MSTFQGQTCSSKFVILISLFIVLCITQCKSQPFSTASNQTYEYGSKFHSNLVTVLADLVQNTPTTGLNVSSYGESPNRVYGLLQCRGDASTKECYDCCQNVTKFAASLCSNKIECRLWLDMCEMHYQNYSTASNIFYNASTDFVAFGQRTLDSTGYKTGFRNLLSNLSGEASLSSRRFAAGSSVDSSGHNIYALVQCFADISDANCSDCLSKAILQEDNLSNSTNSFLSSAIYLDNCFILLSNQTSFSQTSYSKQVSINPGVRGGVLLLITMFLLLL